MCANCGCTSNGIGLNNGNTVGKPEDLYGQYNGVGGTNNPGNSK